MEVKSSSTEHSLPIRLPVPLSNGLRTGIKVTTSPSHLLTASKTVLS
nr:MAG TPA: hypothetical protein [Bacteriophage sp.]